MDFVVRSAGESRYEAERARRAAGPKTPPASPVDTCPACSGLLSTVHPADRHVAGDGYGGVGTAYDVERRCLDCGIFTTQAERRDGSLGMPEAQR